MAPAAAAFPRLFVVGLGTLDPMLVRILRLLGESGAEIATHAVLPSLHYLDDLSVADVATAMGLSDGAVKYHLHQARARLRTLLESVDRVAQPEWLGSLPMHVFTFGVMGLIIPAMLM